MIDRLMDQIDRSINQSINLDRDDLASSQFEKILLTISSDTIVAHKVMDLLIGDG